MFLSTIIPTIGRTKLHRTVQSLLDQKVSPDLFEIIVVNDTGQPLPHVDWMDEPNVQVVTANRHRQAVARNVGAALAQGKYLHFLDDDDWLAPGALQAFFKAAEQTQADWIYGRAQLCDVSDEELPKIGLDRTGNCAVQIMAGEWIPMGSYIVSNELFFSAGGFNALAAPGEDIALCRQLALRADFAAIPETVVFLDRGDHSSTDYTLAWELSRRYRERALDHTGAFKRLHASAEDGYWKGRLARIYLTSTVWNIQHRQLAPALSRLSHALLSSALAGLSLFSRSFWRGLSSVHMSRTIN
ncbi:MAG: glycosyltransferase family 2 protein [Anaerolineae bacterium]